MEYFELWRGGVRLIKTEKAMPVTTDSVLLADFARLPKGGSVCDLGCGSGILALTLLYRYPKAKALLVEVDPDACEAARENLSLNGMEERAEVLNADLRSVGGRFSLVISNPPYFPTSGGASDSAVRNVRRLESEASLSDVADAAARLLGDGGRFALSYPAPRLAEALSLLSARRLEPKRLRLVQARADSRPSIFLAECVKAGRPGITVEPTLMLRDPDGRDSEEARKIYHMGD